MVISEYPVQAVFNEKRAVDMVYTGYWGMSAQIFSMIRYSYLKYEINSYSAKSDFIYEIDKSLNVRKCTFPHPSSMACLPRVLCG